MLVAGLTTILCHRFKQPIVLGYIIAGIIIGPYTPPFSLISDVSTVKTLAELGIIFLMFSLGLEFNLHKLGKVGTAAFIAAFLEIVLMIGLGYAMGRLFGWSQINALFLGCILSISSTIIIIKALNELGLTKEKFAHFIFGILIIEDIFAILILALLSTIATTGSLQFNEIAFTSAKLASFLAVSLTVGILLVPKLLSYIAKFKSNEMLLISVLGLCFGFCLLVAKLNYSVALGAFIMGAIIAESRQLNKIEHLINSLSDMFSAIFFVSVGLLFDPKALAHYFIPILIISVAVVIGKILSCSLGLLLAGNEGKVSVKAGMGLAQIGEFSFIIASLGISLKVTENFLYTIAVGVSIITTILTPYLIKHSDSLTRYLTFIVPKSLSSTFELYSDWIQNIQPTEEQIVLTRIIKRSIINIIINLLIVIAIFLSGSYIARIGHYILLDITITKTLIWALALILSTPFLIAVYRKVKVLSMLLAELSVKEVVNKKLTITVRKIISEIIPILAILGIIIFASLLSVSILPPFGLLILALVITGIILVIFFPWFIKLHSRLQINLIDTIKKNDTEQK